ncbi:MAG: DUF533 domain-containing protein [Aliishimia sp.]
MSLMSTLAKVAVGVAVAKGAQSMMRGTQGGSGGGLGDMLASMTGGAGGAGGLAGALGSLTGGSTGSSGGGLENMLGSLLGGGSQGGSVEAGGLGGLLENLGGSQSSGGLQGMLTGLAGAAGGGGLGAMLGGLTGGASNQQGSNDNSFGAVLNSQFDETPQEAIEPSPDHEAAAALMLRAMIQATKADGELDAGEQAKLIDRLGGDVDNEEAAFVQAELKRPLDVDGLVNETPNGLGPQVYAMSVLGIDLDSQAEAKYLHQLAQGYGLDATTVNNIHSQLGVPSLYS